MAVSGWGIFIIILVLIVIFGGGGYVGYASWRAKKLGLPPPNFNPIKRNRGQAPSNYTAPAPAPGGIRGWFQDKWDSVRNTRTAGGAYESTGYRGAAGRGAGAGGGGRRGFGPLDPDEAWDARVDNEAGGYYEEQELGLQDPDHGPYGGGGYGEVGVGAIEHGRGRSQSRQRELDQRYHEEVHGGARSNPFGENAEPSNMSLRTVSPRPQDDSSRTRGHTRNKSSLNTKGSNDNSPTERRSIFQENM